VERAGVKGWWLAWWLLLCVWPLPVYLLPLLVRRLNAASAPLPDSHGKLGRDAMQLGEGSSGVSVSVTLLLAVLAAHKVLLTCAESLFAHMVTKTPVLQSLDAPEGPQDEAGTGGDAAADV
jgi:hypothetical protein